MPTVPQVIPASRGLGLTPGVSTFNVSPADRGATVGLALTDTANRVEDELRHVDRFKAAQQQKTDSEAADAALTRYLGDMDGITQGTVDPDGNAVPGILSRQAGEAKNAAADFTAAEKKWMLDPESPYSKLTPQARTFFEASAGRYSARFRQQAVGHELAQLNLQRDLDRDAAAQAAARLTDHSIGTPDFEANVGEEAMRHADTVVKSQARILPDGTRVFASPAAETLHKAAAEEYSYTRRNQAAAVLASRAADAPVGPEGDAAAAAHIAAAEAQTALLPPALQETAKNAIDRARSVRETRAKAAEYDARAAAQDASNAERGRLDKIRQQALTSGFEDTDAYVKSLSQSPETDHANRYIEEAISVQEARAKAQASASESQAKEQTAADNRMAVAHLSAGAFLDDTGRLVQLSTQDRMAIATRAFTAGEITEPQWKTAVADAQRDDSDRIRALESTVARNILPKFPGAIVRDPSGDFSITDKRTPKGAPLYSPGADTGLDRTYTRTDPRKNRQTQERQHILLADAVDILNTVKARMASDPSITPEAGTKLFRDLATGTLREYDHVTLADALAQQSLLTQKLKQNLQRTQVTPPAAPASAAKPAPATP